MRYAYLGFTTLTDAQRAGELLARANVRTRLVRMPSEPGISCSFGLRVPYAEAEAAVSRLKGSGIRLGRIVERSSGA